MNVCVCMCVLQSFSDTLLGLTPRFYRDLTEDESDGVSLPWLYIVNKYMHDNHQLFHNLVLKNKDLVSAGEATEVTFTIEHSCDFWAFTHLNSGPIYTSDLHDQIVVI